MQVLTYMVFHAQPIDFQGFGIVGMVGMHIFGCAAHLTGKPFHCAPAYGPVNDCPCFHFMRVFWLPIVDGAPFDTLGWTLSPVHELLLILS
jgi:hypothetical protein